MGPVYSAFWYSAESVRAQQPSRLLRQGLRRMDAAQVRSGCLCLYYTERGGASHEIRKILCGDVANGRAGQRPGRGFERAQGRHKGIPNPFGGIAAAYRPERAAGHGCVSDGRGRVSLQSGETRALRGPKRLFCTRAGIVKACQPAHSRTGLTEAVFRETGEEIKKRPPK